MDVKENISISDPITANNANALDDLFDFEAARKRQEERDLTAENGKLHFKPWRVFVNHIDSYHGKLLVDVRGPFLILKFNAHSFLLPYIKVRGCIKRCLKGKGRKNTGMKEKRIR